MQDKAEGILAESRKTEMNARHAFELLAQSLNDELKVQKAATSTAKKQLGVEMEVKSVGEGDLATTLKDLEEDEMYVKDLLHNCTQRYIDADRSLASRREETKALLEARRVIASTTGLAAKRQYGFIQVASNSHNVDFFNKIEKNIKTMGKNDNNAALMQLAGQIKATVAMNADPFGKVKGLIQDMLSRLLREAKEEATHKAFCDKEISTNEAQRNKLQAEDEKLSTRMEKAAAGVAALKEQIAELNFALNEIAKSQKTIDGIRKDERAEYLKSKAEYEQGLHGVRNALKILREYYQTNKAGSLLQFNMRHVASTDAGNSVISILEICESDFARSLADSAGAEDDAQEVYDRTTQENKVSTATKRANVEGKTQEAARLEHLISDATSDRDGVRDQLSAVVEYLSKLMPQCTTEPESYEERKVRREHEIEGLKSALNILENETAFMQKPAFLSHRKQFAIGA